MNGEDDFEQFGALGHKYGRVPFDYEQILLVHLANMSRLLTSKLMFPIQPGVNVENIIKISTELVDGNFISSTDFLAELLSPYADEPYKKALAELNKSYEKKPVAEVGREFAIKKLGIVVGLMDRLNLLLESEGGEKV